MTEYIKRKEVLDLINLWKRDDVNLHVVDYSAGWNEALEQIESSVKEIPAEGVCPEIHEPRKETYIVDGRAFEVEVEDDTHRRRPYERE